MHDILASLREGV
jgi:hypothetical protein